MSWDLDIKDAFKLSLSLIIAYWVSLSMNWDLPKYSALTVILINQGTLEASWKKGVLRVLGTVIGVTVGFTAIECFGRDIVKSCVSNF